MSEVFRPEDFEAFSSSEDCMSRYRFCLDHCLLCNFNGAITPLIQDVVADARENEGKIQTEESRCQNCSLSPREYQMAIILIIDSLL